MKLAVIIPVSPFEPLDILIKSAKHILSLNYGDLDYKILYVIDKINEKDNRGVILRKIGVEVLERNTTRGKRAGAINDGLKYLSKYKPDYIAIFDVDTRPEKDFIVKCVSTLENEDKAYIVSGPRYILNPINLTSQTIEIEYHLINYLLKKSKFKQFNGLIGVLKADLLWGFKLNECAITEDADFSTRMHCKGYKAILIETKVYEQAPINWKDFFKQRERWYYGGLQLWKYWNDVKSSRDFWFKLSWLSALTLTYIPILFTPLLLLAPFFLIYKYKNIKKIVVMFGLIIYIFILQCAALCAVLKFVRRSEMEWHPIERVLH
ncbi:MAG TPA: glycosyltransferase family 2 protein [Archaeoglobus profundus]|nr:glycosyltransferase family 2 protein [Archaeoglobus profundus]HIP57716.1 glycosyltransferase family 2 protein [Archaeoglobus profundus]